MRDTDGHGYRHEAVKCGVRIGRCSGCGGVVRELSANSQELGATTESFDLVVGDILCVGYIGERVEEGSTNLGYFAGFYI